MTILRFWRELLIVSLVIGLLAYRGEVIGKRAALKAAAIELKAAAGAIKASEDARKQEAAKAKAANAVAEQYEKDKHHAEAEASRLAADLRAGRKRLQERWTCPADKVAGTPGQPDARAEQRIEGASNLVRIGAEADAQIRALQNFISEVLK